MTLKKNGCENQAPRKKRDGSNLTNCTNSCCIRLCSLHLSKRKKHSVFGNYNGNGNQPILRLKGLPSETV